MQEDAAFKQISPQPHRDKTRDLIKEDTVPFPGTTERNNQIQHHAVI
jgi:hypothetical protein